jgi:hypothetical protein
MGRSERRHPCRRGRRRPAPPFCDDLGDNQLSGLLVSYRKALRARSARVPRAWPGGVPRRRSIGSRTAWPSARRISNESPIAGDPRSARRHPCRRGPAASRAAVLMAHPRVDQFTPLAYGAIGAPASRGRGPSASRADVLSARERHGLQPAESQMSLRLQEIRARRAGIPAGVARRRPAPPFSLANPFPLPIQKSSARRILDDIPLCLFQPVFISNKSIEVIPLPEGSVTSQDLVCFAGGIRLP